jgi:cyclophilin family peptidyl-prolyl cis-trans isomerase
VTFTINSPAAENGDKFTYKITNPSDTGKSVTGSGTITATAQSITGVDVSSLANGTLSFSVTLTDTAGNVGLPVTGTATLTQLVITSTPAMTATVGQVFTYTVQTEAAPGDTITVTPGATLPTGMTFDSGTNTFTWTPSADQGGTTQSFSATVNDTTAGNTVTLGPVFIVVTGANGLVVVAPASTIASGSPVLVGFNNANTGTPIYTITTASTSDPTGSKLTATLLPQTNQVLKVVTDQGEMDFELFNNFTPNTVQHFVDLVNSGTYNTGATFYRIIQTFMDQGGVGGSATATTIPDELNANLRFSSSGLLAMANNGVDGNSSEFFITNPDDMSNGFLDFRYTIFGKLISGDSVRAAIAATPVESNGQSPPEISQPLTPPKILSMSVVTQTTGGVVELQAAPGAKIGDTYAVSVNDGLGHTQSFLIHIGTNSFDPPNPWADPINGNDKIFTAEGTPATFTPQGVSADGSAVQVGVQTMLSVTSVPGAYVDNSFLATSTAVNYPVVNPNPNITLTQNGSSYTVTPAAGFYGVQVLEVTAINAVVGTFQLQIGSTTTTAINFDSTDLSATATKIQNALVAAGFAGTKVSVDQSSGAENFSFNVTFPSTTGNITYTAASTNPLPITFANTASNPETLQTLTFTATGPAWDASSGVHSNYTAFVPVYVAPPVPVLSTISANGQTVSNGTTSDNNSSTSTELSFDITGAVAGATVSVYMDGGTTPIATGTVGAGATTITLTTDGSTVIGNGQHTFTVKQSFPYSELDLYADWTNTAGPGAQFKIPAGVVTSGPSSGVPVTFNAGP